MSHRDDAGNLSDMLNHALEAMSMAEGRSRRDLDDDRQFALAMTRLLEIVGEAARRVSGEARDSLSELPWPDIVGLRNRLIHAYDDVDYDVLWDTVIHDLPRLAELVGSYLKTR